jgi:serine/threonine protein kinase
MTPTGDLFPHGCVDNFDPTAQAHTMIGTGSRLGGRYRLESLIAIGGMGEVWRGHDEVLERIVAVKLLKAEYAIDPTFVQRFRAEARNTARLSHPGIATVYDYGEVSVEGAPGDTGYIVMELVPGQPLSSILRERGPLSSRDAMSIVGQSALALQVAHEGGVIHRDIKPGNIMIMPNGHVKLTDFGIARATDDIPLTTTGNVLGTSYYLSPEQTRGHAATSASDVYSLAIVAYECLAGRRPFQDTNPVAVALAHHKDPPPPLPQHIPPPISRLVNDALAKEPGQRPRTADFGRRALALADPTVLAPTVALTTHTAALGDAVMTVGQSTASLGPEIEVRQRRCGPRALLPLIGLGLLTAVAIPLMLMSSHKANSIKTPPTTTPTTSPTRPLSSAIPQMTQPTNPVAPAVVASPSAVSLPQGGKAKGAGKAKSHAHP